MLDFLGIDGLAERTYRLLLTRRDLGIDDLAGELGVAADEVRLALDRLAELTLLRPSWDSPGGIRPVSPEYGMQLLIQRREADLLRQQQQLAESQIAVAQFMQEYSTLQPGRPGTHAERLVGMDAIQARIEHLAHQATEEVATLMPGGPQDPERIEAAMTLDRQVRERGVAMRTVGVDSIRKDPATLSYANWLVDVGAEVRTAPTLPLRMLIYDRRITLIPIDPAHSALGALQVHDAGMVAAVLALFEQIWADAAPIGESAPADECGLAPQEAALLRLLSQGMTDERAGLQLGLSARSVRRVMSGLMNRLGARSRFEAGLKAAQRGWL
ncbi:LuxR C-terminal-related transcriptional regulator [Streptomyces sp. NPDC054794]